MPYILNYTYRLLDICPAETFCKCYLILYLSNNNEGKEGLNYWKLAMQQFYFNKQDFTIHYSTLLGCTITCMHLLFIC